jgi:hypothetical protein
MQLNGRQAWSIDELRQFDSGMSQTKEPRIQLATDAIQSLSEAFADAVEVRIRPVDQPMACDCRRRRNPLAQFVGGE